MQPIETGPSSARRNLLLGVITLVTLGVGCLVGIHAVYSQATDEQRQADVSARSAKVMPFDLTRTMHMFTPVADGGIQTVIANDPTDTTQIQLIRTHLQKEAKNFAVGNFSDPAAIHGEQMPGLAELRAGAKELRVQYESLPNGARLRFSTTKPGLVAVLHKWFEAQRSDHHNHGGM